MKVILVHGFNSDGQSGLFRLQQPLEQLGCTVARLEYRNSFGILQDLIRVRLQNSSRARQLKQLCDEAAAGEDVVVASHSNGATLSVMAAEAGARIDRVVMFNPALSSTFALPKQVRRCDVFACRHDLAVLAGGLLPLHRWGWLGREGYKGRDPRVITWQTADGWVHRGGEPYRHALPGFDEKQHAVRGHSAVLEDWTDAGRWWLPFTFHALMGKTGYWRDLD